MNRLKTGSKQMIIYLVLTAMIVGMIGWIPLSVSAKAEKPKISAKSAVIMNMDTGRILFGKKKYKKRNQASITKLMTVTLAAEKLNEKSKCRISETVSDVPYSRFPMITGDYFYVRDLFYGAMLPSSNGCASALAIKAGGSQKSFVKKMNKKAKALGCLHTHYKNVHGLPASNHYTCAYDTALILRYAFNNEKVRKYMGRKTWSFKTLKKHKKIKCKNTNKLLGEYEGVLGGKTGTTGMAGHCLATVYRYKNHNYAVVVLGSSSNKKRVKDSIKLYRYIRKLVNK